MGLKLAEIRQTTAGDPTGQVLLRHERAFVRVLLGLGVVALLSRIFLVVQSIGSNDMLTWRAFAVQISKTSIGQVYDTNTLFNHPPLMGLFASLCYSLSSWTHIPFDWLFKAPMLLADLGTACLLYWSYGQRRPLYAAGVFALFCCNPVSFLISSYHGNTDSLCASLLLVAAVLMDLRRTFWAGLALAASINVKLVPVLLILPMLACVADRRQAMRFMAGLSIGVIPFLPYLIGHWTGFYEHVLAYRSYPNVWGIGLIAAKIAGTPRLTRAGLKMVELWLTWGTLCVLLWPAALALFQRFRQKPLSARQLAACTMLGFLVITPGWGVQYMVYPAALVFAVSLNGAVWYSLAAGAYLHVTYVSLLRSGRPFFSDFGYGENATGQFLGGLAWVMAARVLVDLLRLRQVHALPALPARFTSSAEALPGASRLPALRTFFGGSKVAKLSQGAEPPPPTAAS
jgi:hypothetical protein